MAGKQGGPELPVRHPVGIPPSAQRGLQLTADLRHRLRIEPGLCQRQPHQLERGVPVYRQRLDRAAEVVEVRVEAEADGDLEPALERLAVQIAGSLVE